MNQAATPALSTLQRLKLDAELAGLARQRTALTAGVPLFAFKVAQIAGKIVSLLRQRGVDLDAPKREREAFAPEGEPDVPEQPRVPTADFYEFDPNRKHSERKKDNAAAMALLRQIDAGEIDAAKLTPDQKRTLAKYSGTGGNLVGADGLQGSAYEYYTPKPIAQGMWDLLGELGFKGGKVLDPCSGVGVFGACAPASVAMESVELNATSGRINQLVNGGPGYNAIISPFEAVANRTGEEVYDAVVSNVPFGGVHDRGANRKIDPKYQDQPLETYFILRSLEKLKPGGLAAFIVPPRVVSAKGGTEEKLRLRASFMAEFMGAYRLPNSVFGTADADTITDVIVFRKFGRDAAQKIEELREQNPGALTEAKVLWQEFVGGMYFAGEGKRFVLGEFQAKDPTKFRDVDRIISDQSIPNIAKLMRKFPGSRIDWKALEAIETEPIVYAEGDTVMLAGQTLEMREGRWVAVGRAPESDRFDAIGAQLTNALSAVSNKVTWADADGYVQYLRGRSMDLEMPVWLRLAHNDVKGARGDEARLWDTLAAGLAAVEVTQEHSGDATFNYLEAYPVLSEALQDTTMAAQKAPTSYSRESKAALTKARIVFSKKTGFSDLWQGKGQAEVDVGTLDEDAQIGALQYRVGAAIDVADLKRVYGEGFDVMADEGWCLDATGTKAMKADDYYAGNYADFLRRIDGEIAAADGPLRDKLLRQKLAASERIDLVDPTGLRFNLFSPFVTMEEKAEFLRRFMNPAFALAVNNLGEPYIVYEGKSDTTEQKLMSRIAAYLSGDAGGRGVRSLSLQGKDLGLTDREALVMLRQLAQRLNTQFDGWVKASPTIMDRLQATANDPERLYFTEVDDNSPVEIPGMNPALKLHGYQNAYVRKQARSFGGINGYEVGLGKTFTALASVQYVQSIAVKKKTIFVVPNSVLSNWRREATRAYANTDDCLFVGLDINEKTGKATVNPANYARDFTRVLENKHRKIFCSIEAFTSIPFKDQTITRYEDHLMSVDPAYLPDPEKAKKADFERANSKLSDVTGATGTKSSALPYFEDMGIDSIVLDEAHAAKNSRDVVNFSGARFLSISEASQRGRDMQMKAWYVRGMSPAADGVLALTATPITNSPLEIYSMLTLAVGEKKVHDLTMGIKGADAFMDAMCIIEDDEDVGIDGTVKSYRIFRGLQNVDLLRNALGSVATIKTAEDVKLAGDDLQLPESPENRTRVMLADATLDRLTEYKMAYRAAKHLTGMAARDAMPPTEEEIAAFERVQARLGEDPELIAHPFNLIQKMTALIADPEMDERASFYSIVPAQRALAETVIAAFNKLGRIEQRPRGGPWTEKEAVVGQKTIKDGGGEAVVLRIKVRAGFTPDGRIWVDTLDYATQLEFEKLADKNKLELDVSIPPKLASLLANVREEEANPRSASGRVKQLIFCDILPLHNKIKRILTQHAGIASSAIEIVSGRSIKNAEQMQGIQDGFNAEGEDNLYRAIIANEKAEVGINLQKGTQANHHLTSGWTPDSQHQRDGRSVRQGNTTKRVNIYKYHADGTFDEYKSTLVSSKADWINAVMDKQGGNEVQVAGGLSAEQYDELIESMGDANAMNAAQARAVLRDQMQRASSARQRQTISLQTAQSQLQFVKDYPTVKAWIKAQAGAAFDLNEQLKAMDKRNTANMKPETLIRFESRKAEMRAKLGGMLRDLDDAAVYLEYNGPKTLAVAINERSSYIKTAAKQREVFVRLAAAATDIKEDSVVAGDWGSQVAQAQAMADEAYKEFERIAAAGGGAFSARMLADFKEGRGRMVDGRPFVPGMFIRNGNSLYIVTDERNAMKADGAEAYLTDALRGGEVIGFESPDYDAAVAEAAAADDARNEVTQFTRNTLYSAHSADVAQRRKTVTMVGYRPDSIRLPSPYFPHPITPEWVANASDFVRGLARSQQAIIGRWDDYRCFVSAAEPVTDVGSTTDQTIIKTLSEYARGNGAKVTPEDIGLLLRGRASSAPAFAVHWGKLLRWPDTETSIERINAVTTIEELDLVQSAIIAEAADWLKLPDNVQMTDTGGGAPSGITTAVFAKRAAIRAAQNPAPVPTPAIALPATGGAPAVDGAAAVNGIPVSPAGNIGLTGGTMDKVNSGGMSAAVKDFIKKAAEEAGARARWRGEKVQWDVTPAAWNVLTTKYPEAAQKLSVVPAAA